MLIRPGFLGVRNASGGFRSRTPKVKYMDDSLLCVCAIL